MAKISKSFLPRTRRGTTAIEMSVVAPVFFLMILGMIELGRMLMIRQALTNAAREGCRKAVLATTQESTSVDATIRSYLQNVIPNSGNAATCRVTVNPSSLEGIQPDTTITTTVQVNYADASWMPVSILGNPVLQGQSTMARE